MNTLCATVTTFCYLLYTYLACGVTSSDADVGDGKRSTSTLGSALMAASRTLGRRCSGGGDMGGGGEEQGDSGTTGTGLAGGGVGDSRRGLDTIVVFCATGGKDAADTTCGNTYTQMSVIVSCTVDFMGKNRFTLSVPPVY
jgi:hypothetical protein